MTITPTNNAVFTIGHSTHTTEEFLDLLQRHEITAVADVRSMPYSRWQPHFNREALKGALKARRIAYAFMGKELGARSDDPECYENGRVQYSRLAATREFQMALEQLCKSGNRRRIALMCAEREPLECHRALLIGRALETRGTQVMHIHADSHLEAHADAIRRLLQILRIPEQDLFRTYAEIVEEAYAKQERRIAYVDEHPAREAQEVHS